MVALADPLEGTRASPPKALLLGRVRRGPPQALPKVPLRLPPEVLLFLLRGANGARKTVCPCVSAPCVSMKYVIQINTHDPIEIARLLALLVAEVVQHGPRGRTLVGSAGDPIGFTKVHRKA